MDPYETQDVIEQVSDKLIEDDAPGAIILIAHAYGLRPDAVAELVEGEHA